MEKKAFIFLVVGLVVGFAAGAAVGYFYQQGQAHETAAAVPAQPPAGGMPPGGMGQAPPPQLTPEQQAQLDRMHSDIQAKQGILKTDPENVKALVELGNLHYDLKEFREAIPYYERAKAKDPNNISVIVDLATAHWYLGEMDPAIAGLEEALKKDPNHPQALNNMGIVMLHGKNDLAAAKKYWNRLLATGTKDIDLAGVKRRLEVIDTMLAQQKAAAEKPGTPVMPPKPGTK